MIDIEQRIREALGEYASLIVEPCSSVEKSLPDASDLAHRYVSQRKRARTVLAVAASCVMVITISATYAYRNNSRNSDSPRGAGLRPAAPTASLGVDRGGFSSLVLRDGDEVDASGEVVAIPGRPTRFCAPIPVGSETNDAAIHYCALGVDVTGVDLSSLSGRRTEGGSIEGDARLIGTYHNGSIAVTSQGPPVAPRSDAKLPEPPCPVPVHGWPYNPGSADLDEHAAQEYQQAHPKSVMGIFLLHPSPAQPVMYVLTSGKAAPVRDALREVYGKSLCVQQSKYTPAEISAARALVSFNNADLAAAGLYSTAGSNLNANGQFQIQADLIRVTVTIARSMAGQPPGLIKLQPWLAPVTN